MGNLSASPALENGSSRRFRHFLRIDRLLWAPALAHYLLCLVIGTVTGTVGMALVFGLVAFPPLLLLAWWHPGHAGNAYGKAVLYMALSALLIEQSGGRIEAHFSIFIMLSALILYSNWRVIFAGAFVIAVHHVLFSYLQQLGMVQLFVGMEGHGHGVEAMLLCLLMHVGGVVAQTIVLGLLAQVLRGLIEDGHVVARFAELAGKGALDQTFDTVQRRRPAIESIALMQESVADTLSLSQRKGADVQRYSDALFADQEQLRGQMGGNVEQVERAASAAAQLSATTRQSTEEASEVRRLAEQAAHQARRGEQEMQALEGGMAHVEADTAGIVELLGGIDQITFQTNLLALNASVEAARVGEHGRGFAVVAGEVRQLSERTREIAQQIRARTQQAGVSVEESVTRTRAAGRAMAEVSETFGRVVERLEGVDDTSRQQHEGIGSLEQSVQEMQASLERSASFLDDSTATTRCLSQTAEALQYAIQCFRLPDEFADEQSMLSRTTSEAAQGQVQHATREPAMVA